MQATDEVEIPEVLPDSVDAVTEDSEVPADAVPVADVPEPEPVSELRVPVPEEVVVSEAPPPEVISVEIVPGEELVVVVPIWLDSTLDVVILVSE